LSSSVISTISQLISIFEECSKILSGDHFTKTFPFEMTLIIFLSESKGNTFSIFLSESKIQEVTFSAIVSKAHSVGSQSSEYQFSVLTSFASLHL
jgi:hypothetical protein